MPTIRLGVDSRPAQQGAKEFRNALGQFVSKPSNEAAKSVKNLDRSMDSLRSTAGSVKGALGGLFAGFASINVLRDATNTIAGFEESLATLQGVSGLDAQSSLFQSLNDKARELGATTAFSAQQAAEGLLFLARAGFTAEEQLAAIGSTLDLATAGGLELGTAADVASNILSQFGLAADQTGRVVDVLVNTANSANTDVTQLGEAMNYVGPVAGALGISIEDTAAAIGKLGDAGIQASSAGTNLRGILLALEAPTTEARNRFEELGANFDKLTSSNISERFEELRRLQIDAADASLLFGRRNAAAALVLAKSADGAKKSLQSLAEANLEVEGVARRNAELIENTLAGSFRSLRSAVEELFLKTGEAGLLGALKQVVDTITGAIRILAGMEESVTVNKEAAQLLADVLMVIAITLVNLAAIKVASTFFSLAKAILSTVGSVRALSAALAANPIGLIALAVALAITAYQKFKDETFQIGDDTVTLGDIVGGVWDYVVDQFQFAVNIMGKLWDNLSKFFEKQWRAVSDFIVKAFQEVTKFLGIDWKKVFDFVLDVAKGVANAIIAAFKSVGSVIGEIFEALKRAGSALLDFDITNPIGSLRKIGLAIDPATIIGNIGEKVGENFTQDFVGEFIKQLPALSNQAKKAIDAEFGEGTFKEFNELFNPLESFDQIRKRALERAKTRAEERLTSEDGGDSNTLEETKRQLDQINLELGKIDQGSDIKVSVEVEGAPSLEMAADSAEKLNINLDKAADKGALGVDRLSQNFDDLGESISNVLDDQFSPQRLQELATRLSDVFSTAIVEVIDGTKSLSEAFEDVVTGVQQAFVENFLLKPLQGILDNLFNSVLQSALGGISLGFADGDVFSNGRPHFFNQGTVISSPVTFPLRGGSTGIAGEAGPEAILPLERDNSGALGVRASMGAGNVEQNDNRTFNVRFVFPNARNADDFKPARRQVVREFERSTRGDGAN